jgi:hypothetical protein
MFRFDLVLGLPLKEVSSFRATKDGLLIDFDGKWTLCSKWESVSDGKLKVYRNSILPGSVSSRSAKASIIGVSVFSLELNKIEGSVFQEMDSEVLSKGMSKAKAVWARNGSDYKNFTLYHVLRASNE